VGGQGPMLVRGLFMGLGERMLRGATMVGTERENSDNLGSQDGRKPQVSFVDIFDVKYFCSVVLECCRNKNKVK
jgi:hypothetical protein